MAGCAPPLARSLAALEDEQAFAPAIKCVGDQTAVDESISIAVLRVVQEALVNIYRHSHASTAKVVLERREDWLQLTVSDDGIGLPSLDAPG